MENMIPTVFIIVGFAIVFLILTVLQHKFFPHTKPQKKESVENTEKNSTKSPKNSTEEKILTQLVYIQGHLFHIRFTLICFFIYIIGYVNDWFNQF